MGILREFLRDLAVGRLGRRDGDDDAAYRCVKCGAGFDRDHHTCPECGGQFLAPADDATGDRDRSQDLGPPGT